MLDDDIQAAMSDHYARYAGLAPQTAIYSAMEGNKQIAENFKLVQLHQQAQVSRQLNSMMNAFF